MSGGALLCSQGEKAPREADNAVKQLEYLQYLVVTLGAREIREPHVRELQSLAVEGIYPCGGRYRDAKFGIEISQSEHVPPDASLVKPLIQQMLEWCNNPQYDALERAAFVLWRFNWIHPFAGGNGRTARALSYLVLCMDFGEMLPGTRTIPGLIAKNRMGYIDALQAVDASVRAVTRIADGGTLTLPADNAFIRPMARYLGDLAVAQVRSAGVSS
ncbi:Fic family protein [Corallococcus sp. AB032C]|nr:Fic family protein [Corallococcus exiguus]RKH86267.1 Fic family protein [Corallococcus sp. AB032C]